MPHPTPPAAAAAAPPPLSCADNAGQTRIRQGPTVGRVQIPALAAGMPVDQTPPRNIAASDRGSVVSGLTSVGQSAAMMTRRAGVDDDKKGRRRRQGGQALVAKMRCLCGNDKDKAWLRQDDKKGRRRRQEGQAFATTLRRKSAGGDNETSWQR